MRPTSHPEGQPLALHSLHHFGVKELHKPNPALSSSQSERSRCWMPGTDPSSLGTSAGSSSHQLARNFLQSEGHCQTQRTAHHPNQIADESIANEGPTPALCKKKHADFDPRDTQNNGRRKQCRQVNGKVGSFRH